MEDGHGPRLERQLEVQEVCATPSNKANNNSEDCLSFNVQYKDRQGRFCLRSTSIHRERCCSTSGARKTSQAKVPMLRSAANCHSSETRGRTMRSQRSGREV